MTRIYSKNQTISLVWNNKNRALAGWKGVSVLAEPIRVIVVIVGYPR